MNFLRTSNVRHVTQHKAYGMGYRPKNERTSKIVRPLLPELLKALNVSAPTGDNRTGTKPLCGSVFDQNMVGSCTAESTCKAIRITQAGKGLLKVEDFSQFVMYSQTRQIERAATADPTLPEPALTDSGCMPDDCITSISKLGIAPMRAPVGGYYNDVWTGNVNQEVVLADEEMTQVALGAYDIDISPGNTSRVSEWQAAANTNIGMTMALFVDTQNFMAYDGSAPVQKIDLNDPQGGGHQICGPCAWYTSSALGLVWVYLNSWSAQFGLTGFVEITDACLMTTIDSSIAYNVELT